MSPSYSISSIPSTVFRIHFLSSYGMSLIPSKYIAKLCDLHRVFISHLYPLCPPTQIIALSTLTPFQMTDTAVLFSSPGNLLNKPFQNAREKISFIAFLFSCLIFLHTSVKSYTLFYTVVHNSSLFPLILALAPYHIYLLSFKTERSGPPDHQTCPSFTWYIFSKHLMFCPHEKLALQKHSQRCLIFYPQVSS